MVISLRRCALCLLAAVHCARAARGHLPSAFSFVEREWMRLSPKRVLCYLKREFMPVYELRSPPNGLLGNKSCAVVSNSGGLMTHVFGSEIDSHDVVLRFNDGPTYQYERNVGSRTTFRLGWNFRHSEQQLALCPELSHPNHNPGRYKVKRILDELYPTQMGYLSGTDEPTSGFYGMLIALSNCGSVDAYEMTPSRAATISHHPYSYYSNKEHGNVNENSWHGYIQAEHDLWARLSSHPASTGVTSFPGFASLDCDGLDSDVLQPGNLETQRIRVEEKSEKSRQTVVDKLREAVERVETVDPRKDEPRKEVAQPRTTPQDLQPRDRDPSEPETPSWDDLAKSLPDLPESREVSKKAPKWDPYNDGLKWDPYKKRWKLKMGGKISYHKSHEDAKKAADQY